MNIFELFGSIALDDSGFKSGVENSKAAFAKLAAAGEAAMSAIMKMTAVTGSEFEEQMSIVKSISGAIGADMEELSEKAKQMGAATQFTAKDSGEAFEHMAMAGLKTKDMLAGLEGVMYAAGASGENLGRVTDIVADVLTGFGLAADQSKQLVDILAEAFSKSSTRIGMLWDALNIVAPIAETVIPLIAKGFSGVVEVFEKLSPLIAGVVAGFSAFNTIVFVKNVIEGISLAMAGYAAIATASEAATKGTTAGVLLYSAAQKALAAATAAVNVVLGIYNAVTGSSVPAIGAATAAQWNWNAAMSANVIGSVIVLVAGLAAGIAALVNMLNKESAAQKELRIGTEKLMDGNDDLLESIEKNKNAYEDSGKAIEANVAVSKKFAENIAGLVDSEGRLIAAEEGSAQAKRELLVYIDQLNEAIPELNLAYDEETGKLNQNIDTIYKRIEAIKEEAKQQAALERSVEIAKEQLVIEEQLVAIARQKAEAAILYGKDTVEYNNAVKELIVQEEELSNKGGVLAESFDHVVEAQIAAKAATKDTGEAFDEQAAKMAAAAEAQKKALESLSAKYETYAGAATDMFGRLSDESELNFDEMLENLKENQRIVGEWAQNIATLTEKGIDEGLLAQLKRMGPEGAGYVAVLAEKSEEELAPLNEAFKAGGETAVDALSKVWEVDDSVAKAAASMANAAALDLETELNNADFIGKGKKVAEGLATGINKKAEEAINAAKQMALAVEEITKNTFVINSPSKLFRDEIGAQLPAGMAEGIKAGTPKAQKAAEKMAKDTYAKAKTWIENYRNDSDYLISEEIKMWEVLGESYTAVSKEKVEIDKKIAKLREEVDKESFDKSKTWIENRKFFGLLSMQEEIDAWERVSARYEEGTKQREEADRALFTARQKMADEQEKLIKKMQDAEDSYQKSVESRAQAIFTSFGLFDALKEKENAREKAYETAQDKVEKLREELAGLNEKRFEETDSIEKAIKAQDDYAKKQKELAAAEKELSAARAEAAKTEGQILAENLKKQVEEMEKWADNLERLSEKGIDEGLLSELRKMGPSASAEILALSNMTEKELSDYGDLWKRKHEIAREQSIKELEGLREETDGVIAGLMADLDELSKGSKVGENILNSIISALNIEKLAKAIPIFSGSSGNEALAGGIGGNEKEIEKSGAGLVSAAVGGVSGLIPEFEEILTRFRQLWLDTFLAVNTGVNERLRVIKEELFAFMAGMLVELDDMLKSLAAIAGVNLMLGLESGMDSMEGRLLGRAREIADAIRKTIEKALEINSPSKWAERVGKFIGEGLVNGMDASIAGIITASGRMSDAVSIGGYAGYGGFGNPAQAGGARENAAPISITQNIQTVPQTPSEMASAAAAAFLAARWEIG